jgi:hypothetical protein
MPVRIATLLAAALLALALPGAALGQGAGDDQYTDPFGSGQTDDGGGSQEPEPTPEPAAPAPEPEATPAPAPAPAQSAGGAAAPPPQQLPYTGVDAGFVALCGALLLAGGVLLRRRLA